MSTVTCCRARSEGGGSGRQAFATVRLGLTALGLGLLTGCGGGSPTTPNEGECDGNTTVLTRIQGDNQTKPPGSVLDPVGIELTCFRLVDNGPDIEMAIKEATITWTVTAGGGTVASDESVTSDQGTAGVIWTLGPAEGTQTLEASFFSSDEGEFSTTFTAQAVTPPPPGVCDGGTLHSTDIPSSETWTAAASPHRLPGSVSLRGDGNVLTIEAGAVVCGESAGSGVFLETGARIVAEGTAASPIRILTKDGVSGWAGIVMNGTPAAGSSLKHLVVERASIRNGPTHPFVLEDATLIDAFMTALYIVAPGSRATRVVITEPSGDGAQIAGDGTTFEGRVTGAGRYGVIFSTGVTDAVTLQNCEVSGGADHGIYAGSFGTVTITGCNIFNNAGNGVHEISSDLTVNAQGNWWGDPAGPGGPAGDGVSGDVDAGNPLAAAVTLGY